MNIQKTLYPMITAKPVKSKTTIAKKIKARNQAETYYKGSALASAGIAIASSGIGLQLFAGFMIGVALGYLAVFKWITKETDDDFYNNLLPKYNEIVTRSKEIRRKM